VSIGVQELLQKGLNLELTKKRLADLDVAIADTESTIRCFRLDLVMWKPFCVQTNCQPKYDGNRTLPGYQVLLNMLVSPVEIVLDCQYQNLMKELV